VEPVNERGPAGKQGEVTLKEKRLGQKNLLERGGKKVKSEQDQMEKGKARSGKERRNPNDKVRYFGGIFPDTGELMATEKKIWTKWK